MRGNKLVKLGRITPKCVVVFISLPLLFLVYHREDAASCINTSTSLSANLSKFYAMHCVFFELEDLQDSYVATTSSLLCRKYISSVIKRIWIGLHHHSCGSFKSEHTVGISFDGFILCTNRRSTDADVCFDEKAC